MEAEDNVDEGNEDDGNADEGNVNVDEMYLFICLYFLTPPPSFGSPLICLIHLVQQAK